MTISRILGAVAIALAAGSAMADGVVFFRIATGSTAGTYYPIGGLIAGAISAPPGTPDCPSGCGVPGVVAAAFATAGSVANVEAIAEGRVESGFVQGDIADWAQTGTGIWQGRPPVEKLRAIANLYAESVHLVARRDAGIETLADLRGKRVSIDENGSGTQVDALMILSAGGLSESDIRAEYLAPDRASAQMRAGDLDAFFFVGGYPAGVISELASQIDLTIVPISGAPAEQVLAQGDFFSTDVIPGGTYWGVESAVPTVSVGAQWITSADQPEALIHDITAALWSDHARRLLDAGHPKGRMITRDTALEGIGVPLHPGAERFYREAGMLE